MKSSSSSQIIEFRTSTSTSISISNQPATVNTPPVENTQRDQKVIDVWAKYFGQGGEFFAASMTSLVVSPWIDYGVQAFKHQLPLSGKKNPIQLSPMSLLLSAPITVLSMYGAALSHFKLDILPLLKAKLQESRNVNQDVEANVLPNFHVEMVDGVEITFDSSRFTTIPLSEAPALSWHDYLVLLGDWFAHHAEYIGLWLVFIELYIEDPDLKLALFLFFTSIAGIAVIPEWLTCRNTLIDFNAFKNYKLIEESTEENAWWLDHLITFSAFAKGIPVLLVSTLNFQQIFFGNLPMGFLAGLYTTMSNMHCQYVMNVNTKTAGQDYDGDVEGDLSECNIVEKKIVECGIVEEQTLYRWKKLPLSQKIELPGCGLSTGTERSEPPLFVLFLFVALSKVAQAGISALFLLTATLTVGSFVRRVLMDLNAYNKNNENNANAPVTGNYNWFGLLKCCRKNAPITEPFLNQSHNNGFY